MAQINSSMSKNSGVMDTMLPDAPKSRDMKTPKAKDKSVFEEHLDAPDAKAVLAEAQKQTNGSARSSSQVSRPAPDKKPLPDREAKVAPKTSVRPSLDKNSDRSTMAKETGKPVEARIPRNPSPTKVAAADDSSQVADEPVKSSKPAKSQLTGMTAKTPQDETGSEATVETNEGALPKLAADTKANPPIEGQTQIPAAAPEAEGDDWQKRLSDMLMFMGIPPQSLQQDLPSLAILTGQLQAIEPASIPAAIAESPLLNQVMASPDPQAIVAEVKPLGAWLSEMGWSPEGLEVQDPEAFQQLMNTPVSLKDLMKTFQVDVDRVVKEAQILQETLPMDGAAPYIQRAQRQQAELPSHPSETRPRQGAKLDKTQSKDTNDSDLALLLGANTGTPASPSIDMSPEAPTKEAKSLSKILEATGHTPSIDQLVAAISAQSANSEGPGQTQIKSVHENPFQAMDMHYSESFQFTDSTASDTAPAPKVNRQDWMENVQAFQIQKDGTDFTVSDANRGFTPDILLERMSEAGITSLDSDSSQESGDESFGSQEAKTPEAHAGTHAHKSQNTFELGTAETQKAQPTHPVQKAVFEKAEMLVKEGGGAIRIELGSKETGSIDLAVEVKNDKVEVKISASSPEARQLIAQELPRLRESLQNQNLNLSKVEVGLTGGSSWTSSDGRSSRQESSAQNEEVIGGVNGSGTRRSSRSYSRVSSSSEIQPEVAREGGGIKVRV